MRMYEVLDVHSTPHMTHYTHTHTHTQTYLQNTKQHVTHSTCVLRFGPERKALAMVHLHAVAVWE
jgi:hypothetical protein